MTTAALVLAALCCCGGTALLSVVVRSCPRPVRSWPYLMLGTATTLLAIAGVRADLGHGGTLELGTVLGFGTSALRVDPLAGLFLALTGVIATPVMLGFAAWSRSDADAPFRSLPAFVALTLAGIVVVVLADTAYVFLFGWESVSLAFYLLCSYRRDLPGRGRAGMLAYAFSKTSGALLLMAFLLLAAATGSFRLADWSTATGAVHDTAYALALLGFTAKVGVVPLQVWLPGGYSAAPGPARALMSAVAANIGFYGMWRTLQILGRPPTWLAVGLLLLAGFTALLGIAHAAVQRDLQRVIAYSSIENGGLITAGYGIALAGAAAGLTRLMALGLLTSGLQMIAHAFAKSSLFLATSRIEQVTGRRDLDGLLGAGRREPATAAAFTLGAFTLAGLPLTVGFVSEWFLLEAVMQLFRLHQLPLELTFVIAGAAIALAAGYAGFTFVRLVGMTVLGGTRRQPATTTAPRLGVLGAVAMLVPAASCIALAAASPWEIRFLAHGLSTVVPSDGTLGALTSPWVLQPVYAHFSALSPSWLAVELPVLALLAVGVAALASRGSLFTVRRVPAWRSATGGVAGDARYTPFAFANPTRHVLGNLLFTRAGHTQVEAETRQEEDAASTFSGPDMPVGEGRLHPVTESHYHAAYTTDVVELVETFLYRPAIAPLRRVVTAAKRLQSGRLDAYIGYMLIALVALLAVVVGLS
ncbi:MAG: proton-conducting transporter transmembrane domain-containing protein [Mycobacteriales bacterium]